MTTPRLSDPLLTQACPHCAGQLLLYVVSPARGSRPAGFALARPDTVPPADGVLRWACSGLDALNSVLDHDFVTHPVYPCALAEYLTVARAQWPAAVLDPWTLAPGDFIKDLNTGFSAIIERCGTLQMGRRQVPVYYVRTASGREDVIFEGDAEIVSFSYDADPALGALRLAAARMQFTALLAAAPPDDRAIIAGIWGEEKGRAA
jgi:hypothetical protein